MGKEIKTSRLAVGAVLALVVAVLLGLYFASNYMLNYSIGYAEAERNSADYWRGRMKRECPWTVWWIDSVYQHRCVIDTFVIMPSGYRAHAIYLFAPKPTPNTAVVVHGYKVRAEGMLHIAYMYNHDLGTCSCPTSMAMAEVRVTIFRWGGTTVGTSCAGRKWPTHCSGLHELHQHVWWCMAFPWAQPPQWQYRESPLRLI